MSELTEKTPSGAILYDPELIGQPTDQLFGAAGWDSATPVGGSLRSSGRGQTMYLQKDGREYVMRPYMRGGLIGHLIERAFVWRGAANTRSFVEWRLLAKMTAMQLPVPIPAAARYVKSGSFYRAELLTVCIPGIRSLTDRLLAAEGSAEFWNNIGTGIGNFHAAGVNHPDLNAYNLQVDNQDNLWLLDFDRGKFSSGGPWRQKNIARLHRSFLKVKGLDKNINFAKQNWEQFLDGYFSVSRSA